MSLALICEVERFYFYLARFEFELMMDHKPLKAIFRPTATTKPPSRLSSGYFDCRKRWFSNQTNSILQILYGDNTSWKMINHSIRTVNIRVHKLINKYPKRNENITSRVGKQNIAESVNKINNNTWGSTEANVYVPFFRFVCLHAPLCFAAVEL